MRRPASRSPPSTRAAATRSAKGQYLIVEDAELEAIEIESTHTIEIDSFVPRRQIDQRFFDTPYYVTPNEPVGQEAFAVIREAMRRKAMVALGRLVLSKRERVIALEPYDKGLLGTTLRYPYEVRDAKDYFCRPAGAGPCARHAHARRADPRQQGRRLRSRRPSATATRRRCSRTSRPSRPVPCRSKSRHLPRPRRVINLMEALRRSIAEDNKRPRRARRRRPARKRA